MFIANELVFVELHKTGCSHIGKLLASILGGMQYGKHNRPSEQLLVSGRKFLGSVRNPWDFYVSLWAYGCGKKGLVYTHTTRPLMTGEPGGIPGMAASDPGGSPRLRPARKPEEWRRCYADPHNAAAFRDWLYMINDENYWHDFGEGYGESVISEHAGLFTYRFASLFCRHAQARIAGLDDIKAYIEKNCYIDRFIRTENLEDDLIAALEACNIRLDETQKCSIYSAKKTNASSRTHETAYYYDNAALELVRNREGAIIEMFSHVAPGI